jgi:hypothetical protein
MAQKKATLKAALCIVNQETSVLKYIRLMLP